MRPPPRPRPSAAVLVAVLALASACTQEQPTSASLKPSFWITPPPEEGVPGRMTGGGGNLTVNDISITKGFTIHCDIILSNNLEINWPGNKWHIEKPLTSAKCVDDPAFEPAPPVAPFDTFYGTGEGALNGEPGSTVEFRFIDGGEPGAGTDMVEIYIFAPNGDLVLQLPLSYLDHGNMQAHYDQPHK